MTSSDHTYGVLSEDPIFLDYETYAIGPRPNEFPPTPVGIAILDRVTGVNKYLAWGHDIENNCTYEEALAELTDIWNSGRKLCFHNAAFDCAVAEEKMGLPWPRDRLDDTLVRAFLHDSNVPYLSLKYLAEKWCGIKPDARDAVFDWLVENIPEVAKKPKSSGAYICKAPGKLVGEYASDDVKMTAALYDFTAERVDQQPEAHARDVDLLEMLHENEMEGIPVDRALMQEQLDYIDTNLPILKNWLDDFFGLQESTRELIKYGSGAQLYKLLVAAGEADPDTWPQTEKGNPATDKFTLEAHIKNQELVSVLRYFNLFNKLKGTYLVKWLEASEDTGRLFTQWNSVRGEAGGTRTGRLSGKPSLQTIPQRTPDHDLLPECFQYLELPQLRKLFIPDEGHQLIASDFSGQELRIFAHYEDGTMAEMLRKDPDADVHTWGVGQVKAAADVHLTREYGKFVVFTVIYGGGQNRVSEALNVTLEQAALILTLYKDRVFPGIKTMQKDMDYRYRIDAPFRSLGGRLLRGERPKVIKGRLRTFAYKNINLLVQGGAADQCKQALLDYWRHPERKGRMYLSVHDEIVVSSSIESVLREAEIVSDCMVNAITCSVPMRSDSIIGNNLYEVKG